MTTTAPTGEPLVGRFVRLDRMVLDDAPGLHRVFSNPDNYADGYAMSRPSASLAETEETVRGRMDKAPGHVAYTARLVSDGTVVGTSSIGDVEVEHERAHVDLRHGLVLRLAEVNAACLPRVRAAAEMMRSSALLVELVADDAAARRCGTAVASALRTLGTLEDDESMLLRALRLEQRQGAAQHAEMAR